MAHTQRCAAWLALLFVGVAAAATPTTVSFNKDIRAIMSDTCFKCHGPDKRARMAGLRLDIRDEALKTTKSGIVPIVPGDPSKSAVIDRIFSTNARIMPPKFAHKELTAAQKETVKQWVAEGAVYEGHWAYQPVKRPAVPQLPPHIQNPIDAFIQERLSREGLQPSPEADRRTLIRRVTFDLAGLPPTPQEVDDFEKDKSPGAYEKVVDRLLSSPRFAEVQAMHWLDAVRYSDSAGFHGDNLWPAWPYRDYVLRAFRDNMPFDRFTREQIAGDLLPDATVDQKVASAYNRLNRASAEGGLQAKEYLAKYGADRVRTTSTVWLGSTLGCAECHDHKFDPFLSKDFYAMKAFFADIKETGLIPDRGAKAWGSKLLLATDRQKTQLEQLETQIKSEKTALDKRASLMTNRRVEWEEKILKAQQSGELAWAYQRPVSAQAAHGATLTIFNEEPVDFNYYLNGSLASERKPGGGLVVASGPNPDNETYTVNLKPGEGTWTSAGIEIQQDESLPGNRLARGADRFVLTDVDGELVEGAKSIKLVFVLASSTGFGEPPEHTAMAAIDGDRQTGWGVSFGEHRNAFLALRLAQPVHTSPDSVLTIRLRQDAALRRATIGRFRLALSSARYSAPETGDSGQKKRMAQASENIATLNVATDRGLPPEVRSAIEMEEPQRSEAQSQTVLDYFEWSSPEFQDPVVHIAQLQSQRALLEATIPRSIYTETMRPRVTRILARANWMDDSGEIVEPAVPAFLGKLNTEGRRANRLDLANWLASPENPLTARVYVNRMWRQFFGTGLSKVLEDLGSQGEWPTHPELLDWLAAEFMQPTWNAEGAHAWDMTHIVKTIVTSQTYRQSSMSTPALDEKDIDNRLLARQNRFRVDAEFVHDTALSVSGLLAGKFGGPSVRPYEPEGYLTAMNFPKREYSAGHGDDLHRRALYTQWQRTFLHPTLLTLDAPTREECTVNRVNSNTPLQALILLNDPIFVEASRAFAQNILKSGGKRLDDQIGWAFERALSRAPEKEERRILSDLYQKSAAHFRGSPSDANKFLSVGEWKADDGVDPVQLAAMSTVARAILNLHETITRN